MSAVKRWWPCHATANPPTTTYSTLLALSNSINSRKSLLIRIRVNPGLQFKNDRYPLLRGHGKVFFDICRLGRFKAAKIAGHAFHSSILQVPGRPRGISFQRDKRPYRHPKTGLRSPRLGTPKSTHKWKQSDPRSSRS